MKKKWIVFTLKGKELLAISINGYFIGEVRETKELLAYENDVTVDEIETKIKEV